MICKFKKPFLEVLANYLQKSCAIFPAWKTNEEYNLYANIGKL